MWHVTGSTNGTVNHVADMVEESKERCCENFHRLVSIISIFFQLKLLGMELLHNLSQVEGICEAREDR